MWKILLKLYAYDPVEKSEDYVNIREKASDEGSDVSKFLGALKVSQKIQKARRSKKKKKKKNEIDDDSNDKAVLDAWKESYPTKNSLNPSINDFVMALRTLMPDFSTYLRYVTDKVEFRKALESHDLLSSPKKMEDFLKRFYTKPDRYDIYFL